MPSDSTGNVKAAELQRRSSKRATLESLRAKKPRIKELVLTVDDDELEFSLRAIGTIDYDRLVTAAPPNLDQRASGAAYDINTFGPSLLSRVIVDPDLKPSEWNEIWASPAWGRGEVMTLFSEAVELCSMGLNVGPTGKGSA